MNQTEFEQAIHSLPLEKAAFFASIGSTNDVIAEWARDGAKGLCLAAAGEQTRGRGRAGRRWFTPKGSALAFSLLLDLAPSFDPAILGRASGLGALAVYEGLEALYSLRPEIKWPNDVLLEGKKVAGILPEAHWSGTQLQALILGIGVNVSAESLPAEDSLTFPATNVEAALGKKVKPGELLRGILVNLIKWKPGLAEAEFIRAWETRLANFGETVQINNGNGVSMQAVIEGLGEDGSIRMRMSDGDLRAFQAGEIQLRPLLTDN